MSKFSITICAVARGAGWHAWSTAHEAQSPVSAMLAARECASRALACAEHEVVLEPIGGAEGLSYRAWRKQSAWALVGELAATLAIAGSIALAITTALLWLMDGRAS